MSRHTPYLTHGTKISAIAGCTQGPQWIGSARDIRVHLRASAANLSSLRDSIAFGSTLGLSCRAQQKKILPQMHADARRCRDASGSFGPISRAEKNKSEPRRFQQSKIQKNISSQNPHNIKRSFFCDLCGFGFFRGLCVKILFLPHAAQVWHASHLTTAHFPCLDPNAITLP